MRLLGAVLAAAVFVHCGACRSQPIGPGRRPAQDRQPAPLEQTRLTIALGEANGQIRPLLGVNAGPAPSGERENVELSEQYRWAGVNAVRTQDFYGPLDLSVMYPDLAADPADPHSYDFTSSDAAFDAILRAGLEPYLRLGDSWNDVRVPRTPQEHRNYARAALEVVSHYRQRAQGRLRYVEIGNEPDNQKFWPSRYEEFFPFFAATALAIKRQFPELKAGGPGFVVSSYKIPSERSKVARFLGFLQRSRAPVDFLSFHLYSNDPGEYRDIVTFYRDAARRAGLEGAELHITEWNTEGGGRAMRVGDRAAPCVTACWIALQEAGVDGSYLFRGTDTNIDNPEFYGIFHADGRKKPAANAFRLWSQLTAFPRRVAVRTGIDLLDRSGEVNGPLKPLWILAGRDAGDGVAVLLANIGRERITYGLDCPGAPETVEVSEIGSSPETIRITTARRTGLAIGPSTVQLVRLKGS